MTLHVLKNSLIYWSHIQGTCWILQPMIYLNWIWLFLILFPSFFLQNNFEPITTCISVSWIYKSFGTKGKKNIYKFSHRHIYIYIWSYTYHGGQLHIKHLISKQHPDNGTKYNSCHSQPSSVCDNMTNLRQVCSILNKLSDIYMIF